MAITLLAMLVTKSPWLTFLTIINVYQLLMIGPLGWGDTGNDRKLDAIINSLENNNGKRTRPNKST